VKVAHPNLFSCLGHLQRTTTDNQADIGRLNNDMAIRRPKKRANIINDARINGCIRRFDSKSYTRLQFLCAVSHGMGAHSDMLCADAVDSDSGADADGDGDDESRNSDSSRDTEATVDTEDTSYQRRLLSWCHANSASLRSHVVINASARRAQPKCTTKDVVAPSAVLTFRWFYAFSETVTLMRCLN